MPRAPLSKVIVTRRTFDEIAGILRRLDADVVLSDGCLDMSGLALEPDDMQHVATRPGRAYALWPEYERLRYTAGEDCVQ